MTLGGMDLAIWYAHNDSSRARPIKTDTQQLAMCACQLSYGKLYKAFSTKWVFLSALAIFEVGSLVCGATPTSVGLIMGRVVAGFGSAGIFSGVS
jgi:MFS family permease